MINSSRFSRTFVRKFWTAAGNLGGVAGLLMICFADCDRTLAVTGLCVAMGISGINAAGYLVRIGWRTKVLCEINWIIEKY